VLAKFVSGDTTTDVAGNVTLETEAKLATPFKLADLSGKAIQLLLYVHPKVEALAPPPRPIFDSPNTTNGVKRKLIFPNYATQEGKILSREAQLSTFGVGLETFRSLADNARLTIVILVQCFSDRVPSSGVAVTKIAKTAIWDRRKAEITVPRYEYQRYDVHYNILQKDLVDGGWLAADGSLHVWIQFYADSE
jgi:hypothetical protein